MTPVQFCAEHDWLGNDVWFAHLVKLLPEEIALLGRTGTGIAHCPQSNGRLGSGIADLLALEQAGVPVSLGVDGAASNEAADMQSEAHAAWLLQRARKGMLAQPRYAGGTFEGGADAATVEDVVRWGSAGGAQILGLAQSGTLQVGMQAGPCHLPAGRSALLRPARYGHWAGGLRWARRAEGATAQWPPHRGRRRHSRSRP